MTPAAGWMIARKLLAWAWTLLAAQFGARRLMLYGLGLAGLFAAWLWLQVNYVTRGTYDALRSERDQISDTLAERDAAALEDAATAAEDAMIIDTLREQLHEMPKSDGGGRPVFGADDVRWLRSLQKGR